MTQGAVAQQVRGLEAHLGVRLFDRHARGLTLTEAGRHYHVQIAQAFRLIERATGDLAPQARRVTISVTPSFASKWLIPNMAGFAAKHPDIDLRVLATEALSQFRADAVDIVVRYERHRPKAGLDTRLLFRGDVIAVCAADLPGQGLEGRALVHDSLDHWPAYIETVLGHARPGPLPGPRFSTITLAIEAALAGQGVALASRFLVARDLASGRLVQAVSGALRLDQSYVALCPRDALSDPARRIVFDWLADTAE